MKPPKCRNCGVEEWRHVCSGSVFSSTTRAGELTEEAVERAAEQIKKFKSARAVRRVVVNADVVVNKVVVNARTKDRHKGTPERRAYVAKKMRQLRARRAAGRVSG